MLQEESQTCRNVGCLKTVASGIQDKSGLGEQSYETGRSRARGNLSSIKSYRNLVMCVHHCIILRPSSFLSSSVLSPKMPSFKCAALAFMDALPIPRSVQNRMERKLGYHSFQQISGSVALSQSLTHCISVHAVYPVSEESVVKREGEPSRQSSRSPNPTTRLQKAPAPSSSAASSAYAASTLSGPAL